MRTGEVTKAVPREAQGDRLLEERIADDNRVEAIVRRRRICIHSVDWVECGGGPTWPDVASKLSVCAFHFSSRQSSKPGLHRHFVAFVWYFRWLNATLPRTIFPEDTFRKPLKPFKPRPEKTEQHTMKLIFDGF